MVIVFFFVNKCLRSRHCDAYLYSHHFGGLSQETHKFDYNLCDRDSVSKTKQNTKQTGAMDIGQCERYQFDSPVPKAKKSI